MLALVNSISSLTSEYPKSIFNLNRSIWVPNKMYDSLRTLLILGHDILLAAKAIHSSGEPSPTKKRWRIHFRSLLGVNKMGLQREIVNLRNYMTIKLSRSIARVMLGFRV